MTEVLLLMCISYNQACRAVLMTLCGCPGCQEHSVTIQAIVSQQIVCLLSVSTLIGKVCSLLCIPTAGGLRAEPWHSNEAVRHNVRTLNLSHIVVAFYVPCAGVHEGSTAAGRVVAYIL